MKNTVAQLNSLALSKESSVKKTVVAGLCILAILVSMYVYFVGKIVFDVVGRRTAEASIKHSESDISALAVNYFSQVKNLDIAQATSVGLSVSNNTLYASRPTATASLGMAHDL